MFLAEIGRKCDIVNLDFANDKLPYKPSIDVRDLISLEVQLGCSSLSIDRLESLIVNNVREVCKTQLPLIYSVPSEFLHPSYKRTNASSTIVAQSSKHNK